MEQHPHIARQALHRTPQIHAIIHPFSNGQTLPRLAYLAAESIMVFCHVQHMEVELTVLCCTHTIELPSG